MSNELHVTSPLMRGPLVLKVQERLNELGYPPGPLDGGYGPTTAAAVEAFQTDHGLVADGWVGPITLAALESATRAPAGTPPRESPPNSIVRRACAEAVKYLGLTEQPPGSNHTLFGEWFGINGVPWCNIFVSHAFAIGAGYVLADGFRGAGVRPGKGCAYVPTTEAWLRATGLWVGRTRPQIGDIAIYNWDGGAPDHIGIVERVQDDGTFVSIEGNTAIGNDSNGGQVMRRNRYLTQVNGFGRIVGQAKFQLDIQTT